MTNLPAGTWSSSETPVAPPRTRGTGWLELLRMSGSKNLTVEEQGILGMVWRALDSGVKQTEEGEGVALSDQEAKEEEVSPNP